MTAFIVPTPVSIVEREGVFALRSDATVWADDEGSAAAAVLRRLIGPPTGAALERVASRDATTQFEFSVDRTQSSLGREGYRITVGDDRVTVAAADPAGLLWSVQTIRQLFPAEVFAAREVSGVNWTMPAIQIVDRPRFPWRGIMIDVARWFLPLPELIRLVELAAMHKVSILQLHLTDDQGWRFESRKYPRLTEVGAWRSESMLGGGVHEAFDRNPHGGFYRQDELRALVAHAAALGVTVVPEVDAPGHMTAAIAAYPSLGNRPDVVLPVGTRWGVIEEILNVEEDTVAFVRDVLDEIMEVFPGPFIHIGGDECPRTEWQRSPRAQERKRDLGLETDDQLYSWFIGRLVDHVTSRGRKPVGWDEIREGDDPPRATVVMSWRGDSEGMAAAHDGYDVVMVPEDRMYLDHYQEDSAGEPWAPRGLSTIERILEYDPIPAELTRFEASRILGTQCNVWTEYIPITPHLHYMVFPRACALAEVAWGSPERDAALFRARLEEHLRRLDHLGVGYRRPRALTAGQ